MEQPQNKSRLTSGDMAGRRQKEFQENKRKSTRRTGADYERAAGYYLEKQGCEVLEYNYRCRAGEIDLIAKDGEYLVFCEVKYRSDGRKGSPLEAVDDRKQRRICRAASSYLARHGLRTDQGCRFDVVAITGEKIRLVKNAFPFHL